jgi:hypothetical protein
MLGVFVHGVLVGVSRVCLYSRARRDKVDCIARLYCCPDGLVAEVIVVIL